MCKEEKRKRRGKGKKQKRKTVVFPFSPSSPFSLFLHLTEFTPYKI
jgi:hypothetical protein